MAEAGGQVKREWQCGQGGASRARGFEQSGGERGPGDAVCRPGADERGRAPAAGNVGSDPNASTLDRGIDPGEAIGGRVQVGFGQFRSCLKTGKGCFAGRHDRAKAVKLSVDAERRLYPDRPFGPDDADTAPGEDLANAGVQVQL